MPIQLIKHPYMYTDQIYLGSQPERYELDYYAFETRYLIEPSNLCDQDLDYLF